MVEWMDLDGFIGLVRFGYSEWYVYIFFRCVFFNVGVWDWWGVLGMGVHCVRQYGIFGGE